MELVKQFDLTDPKILWKGSIDDEFTDDLVIVLLRKTSTYPELELRHFKLDNAESMRYIGKIPSPGYMNPDFRQIISITLREHGKDKVVEAIRHLETIEFVKCAEPNGIEFPGSPATE